LLRLPVWLWARALAELRRRGAGRRESGAFLLGKAGEGTRIRHYLCYDDLDPDAYQNGGIAFHAVGYAALWRYCRERKLQVLADVHTHPGPDVRQSTLDQRHPMLPMQGHTAVIVPNFGRTPWWSLRNVGVYEYLGEFKWRTRRPIDDSNRLKLSIW
jgi:proteasome lid subunit RPN8/RPN11